MEAVGRVARTLLPGLALFVLSANLAPIALAAGAGGVVFAGRELSPEDLRRLGDGEILTRWEDAAGPNRMVASAGTLPVSPRDAWALATDFRNYDRIYSGISESRVVSEAAREVVGTYTLKLPWPLPQRWVTTRAVLEPERRLCSWQKEAGTVKAYAGHLQMLPWAGRRTLMLYSARIDPDFAFLPTWFWDWAQETALPSVVSGLRDTFARQEGPYWQARIRRPDFEFVGRRESP
ncbi:MAG: SRPBCC family protein [Candidatus Sericytochromatia bacterium]|nr:SRPBCC family protein [Candidatus Sericytochromatia bacterium]